MIIDDSRCLRMIVGGHTSARVLTVIDYHSPFDQGLSFISHGSFFVLYSCEVRARDIMLLALLPYTLGSEIPTILYTSNLKNVLLSGNASLPTLRSS